MYVSAGEKISRLSLHDRDDHDISSYHSISSSLHMSYDQAYDINTKLQWVLWLILNFAWTYSSKPTIGEKLFLK